MSSGSGSGSGADQHLLALLRAIRLRQAAPDAVAAGIADAAAALTHPDELTRRRDDDAEHSGDGPSAGDADHTSSAGDAGHAPSGRDIGHPALPPGPVRSALTAGPLPASERPASERPASEHSASEHSASEHPASEHLAHESGTAMPPRPGWAGKAAAGRTDRDGIPDRPGLAAGAGAATEPDAGPADGADPERGGDPAGAELRAGARGGADLAGFADGVGRPSRNRFGGLTPVRREPPAPPAEVEDEADVEASDPAAGRPQWALGEPGAIHGVEGAVRPAPRVPGLDGPAHIAPPMVAAPGRAPAVDGMDPVDDALLRETQRLLSTSLTFAGGPAEVAGRFRAALLQAYPELLAKVPGDARTQTAQLARGLTWLVHHLDQPPVLVSGCGRLGAALAACGVAAGKLQLVGAALAEAIRAGMPAGAWRQDFDLAWRSTWQHAYEWIRHGAATAGYDPPTWTATVVSHELRRPDLAVLRLRPDLPMPFRPGQFARIEVGELPGIWRPYSLAGAPRRDDILELHVRAKTRNGVSGTLVYRTGAGDQVRLSRAEGEMGLPDRPERGLLMIAGDTGVAPLKALLTELADTGDARSAVLFWGVRDLSELYDIEDIAEIARSAKRVTVVPVISEGDPGPYASGLVTDAVAAYGEWSGHEVYLAGPPLMLAATGAALHQLGVSPDHIHHDAPE